MIHNNNDNWKWLLMYPFIGEMWPEQKWDLRLQWQYVSIIIVHRIYHCGSWKGIPIWIAGIPQTKVGMVKCTVAPAAIPFPFLAFMSEHSSIVATWNSQQLNTPSCRTFQYFPILSFQYFPAWYVILFGMFGNHNWPASAAWWKCPRKPLWPAMSISRKGQFWGVPSDYSNSINPKKIEVCKNPIRK